MNKAPWATLGPYPTGVSRIAIAIATVSPLAAAQTPGHRFHPPMPDQHYQLSCWLEEGGQTNQIDTPLRLESPSVSSGLSQTVELPAPWPALTIVRYVPRASLTQSVLREDGRDGVLAVKLTIEGPKQSYDRWLVAGDPQRNRLSSLIGTWRFMAVATSSERDELYRQFAEELVRPPVLRVTRRDDIPIRDRLPFTPRSGVKGQGADPREGDRGNKEEREQGTKGRRTWIPAASGMTLPNGDAQQHGRSWIVPALEGHREALEEVDCDISVERFFPHYGLDPSTGQDVNQSERRTNPAAFIKLTCADHSWEGWVFAQFPEFRASALNEAPCRIELDCPVVRERMTPDHVLVHVTGGRLDLFLRQNEIVSATTVALGDPVKVAGSNYAFVVREVVENGRLEERYEESSAGGVTVIEVRTKGAGGATASQWLELGRPVIVETSAGPMRIALLPAATLPTAARHP